MKASITSLRGVEENSKSSFRHDRRCSTSFSENSDTNGFAPRDAGETIVLEKNTFVERILPASIMRELSDEEMAEYRRPFTDPGEDRRPTLTWPRQLPIEGTPSDVRDAVSAYAAWMAENDIPKYFVNADPGTILIGRQREFCRTWRNQREITVPGIHFIQEDSGDEIGAALREWLLELG